MKGSICIITGANRGIGKETARGVARSGCTVILACRNLAEAELVRREISLETGNAEIEAMALDISSRESIRAFVEAFGARYGRLNLLINNAGISNTREAATVDGLEPIVGTNYFGTFILTQSLLPLFERGADNRIVNTVSNIYTIGRFRLERISRYRWFKAYAVSKYMLLLYTLELAGRLEDEGITVNAVHPGIVRTSIMYTRHWYDILIKVMLDPFFVEPRVGAETGLFLALSESVRGQSGRLWAKCAPIGIPPAYDEPELRNELWRASVEEMARPAQGASLP